MVALMRCPCCKGRKNIMSLGGIYKACKECLSVGHIKIIEADEEEKLLNKKPRKKRLTNAEYKAIKKSDDFNVDITENSHLDQDVLVVSEDAQVGNEIIL